MLFIGPLPSDSPRLAVMGALSSWWLPLGPLKYTSPFSNTWSQSTKGVQKGKKEKMLSL